MPVDRSSFLEMNQKKRSFWVSTLCVVVATVFVGAPSFAASNGGKCAKAGVIQKTKGVTYTCVRMGKLLKWARKNARQSTTTTSAPLSMADLLLTNPPSPHPLSNCRLTDARTSRQAESGRRLHILQSQRADSPMRGM